MSFLEELKRRRVVRVALVYAATAFVVWQAADIAFPALHLPAWMVTAVVALTLLGFPIALVLTWAFQITPDGVQRSDAGSSETERWLSGRTLAAVGVALLLVMASAWFINPVVSERLARTGARAASDDAVVRAPIDLGDFVLGNPGEMVISPDGRTLALVAEDASGGWGLFVRRIDEEDFQLLTSAGRAFRPQFSPDGAWLVFQDYADYGVKRIPVAGGAVQTLVPGSGRENVAIDWGRDGTILIGSSRGLRRIPEAGGVPTLIREGEFEQVQALPGGGVLFTEFPLGRDPAIRYLAPDAIAPIDIVAGATGGRFVDAAGGVLLYTDVAGTLWAMPFDGRRGRSRAPAVRMTDRISGASTSPRFSVSSTGTLVYARGPGEAERRRSELLIVTLDGRESSLPLTPRSFEDLRWSPRGDQLAFTAVADSFSVRSERTQLFIYDVRLGTAPRRLTQDGLASYPVWSPDGRRIAVAMSMAGDRQAIEELTIVDAAGALPPRVVRRATGIASFPTDWPRENQLVFDVWDEEAVRRTGVWRMDPADSSSATLYLATEANVRSRRISPQGDLAAYASQRQVFVRSFPQPGPPVTASPGNAFEPAWSPDGTQLYFWKSVFTQPGATRVPDSLFVATVRRQPSLSVDPPRFVLEGFYETRTWDLHPDGDRFIVVRRPGEDVEGGQVATPRYFIATNWFSELEAALATVKKP